MTRRSTSFLAAAAALAGLLAVADACWLEPRVLLFHDVVRLPLIAPPLRVAHLSDLHVTGDTPLLHDLLRQVAATRPGLVAVTGDFIRDVPDPATLSRHIAAAAAFISQLRRLLPGVAVLGVQGHSEYTGEVVAALRRAGVHWLSDEGCRVGAGGPGGSLLVLGLNQQVGIDRLALAGRSPFRLTRVDGRWALAARLGTPLRNFYSHYDPDPASLADAGGPLAWSGYDAVCDVRIDRERAGAGIEVHSRYVLGEDRMIRLRRMSREDNDTGTFWLLAHGSVFTGGAADHLDTGVEPRPGRWYRLRLRTRVAADAVRVWARVWPADESEPPAWQAWAVDASPDRVTAGTVGVWAWGGGTALYRGMQVTDAGGQVLLDEVAAPAHRPRGWREEARGTRLELALARSPAVPAGTPRLVLSHTPDVVLEASQLGIEAVLAGHTHGGQVRLPFVGALTTRSSLGAFYDRGVFDFAAPNRRGLTTLYINSGVGTSLLPIRFLCPPRFAVVELGGLALAP